MKKYMFLIFLIAVLLPCSAFGADVKLQEEYMEDTGFYRYYLDNDNYIQSSVRLDSVVENIVRITYNDYVDVTVYKDGKIMPYKSGDYIYSDGEYTIVLKNDNDTGRINFIRDAISAENIDLEDEFYNNIKFRQSYDTQNRMYKLDMGSFYSIYVSVPNFAVTQRGVQIYAPQDERAHITATKDGDEISFTSGKIFSEPGYYTVNVVYDVDSNEEYDDMSDVSESELYNFSEEAMDEAEAYTPDESNVYGAVATVAEYRFYVSKGVENKLNFINPPQDYVISSIVIDGKKADINDNMLYKVTADGTYIVTFESTDGIMPDYNFTYRRDRTAPRLELAGLGKGGIAKGALAVNKTEDDTEIVISSNGSPLVFSNNVIDIDGLYQIKASDDAGNVSTYLVNVDIPMSINPAAVIVVTVIIAGGLWVYIKHIKSDIKVR